MGQGNGKAQVTESDDRRLVGSTTDHHIVTVEYVAGDSRRAHAKAYVYEVDMLLFTLDWFAKQHRDSATASRKHDACLEAFLVHARVLISFFYPTIRRDDDVRAESFLREPMQQTGAEAARLIAQRTALDKRLAHLTTERREPHDGYQLVLIAGDLLALHAQFVEALRDVDPIWRVFDSLEDRVRKFGQNHGAEYRRIVPIEDGKTR